MGRSSQDKVQWGGRIWLLAIVAVVLTVVILLVVLRRPLAWSAEEPFFVPDNPKPGLFEIPTVAPQPQSWLDGLPLNWLDRGNVF